MTKWGFPAYKFPPLGGVFSAQMVVLSLIESSDNLSSMTMMTLMVIRMVRMAVSMSTPVLSGKRMAAVRAVIRSLVVQSR